MRTGIVFVAMLAAASASAAEPAVPRQPLVTRTYPVLDLIHPLSLPTPLECAPLGVLRLVEVAPMEAPRPQPAPEMQVGWAAGWAPVLPPVPCPPPVSMPSEAALVENAVRLRRNLVSTVRTGTWVDAGGHGSARYDIRTHAFTVRQTETVHSEIAEYLASLRKRIQTQVTLEMRVVEVQRPFIERVVRHFVAVEHTDATAASPPARVDPREEPIVLSQAECSRLLEAIQGDRRASVLQAPRVTTIDREPICVQVTESVQFLTGLELVAVRGGMEKKERVMTTDVGTRLVATPTVTADRSAVSVDLGYEFAAVDRGIPMLPVQLVGTAGRLAEAVLQNPVLNTMNMKRTAVIPDGMTAVFASPSFLREEQAPRQHLLLVTARIFEPEGAEECPACRTSTVAKLITEYRAACAEGRTEDAIKLAMQALARDPACFVPGK